MILNFDNQSLTISEVFVLLNLLFIIHSSGSLLGYGILAVKNLASTCSRVGEVLSMKEKPLKAQNFFNEKKIFLENAEFV